MKLLTVTAPAWLASAKASVLAHKLFVAMIGTAALLVGLGAGINRIMAVPHRLDTLEAVTDSLRVDIVGELRAMETRIVAELDTLADGVEENAHRIDEVRCVVRAQALALPIEDCLR